MRRMCRQLGHAIGYVGSLHLLAVVLLYFWSRAWHFLPCLWMSVVSIVVVVVISGGLLEVARMRRRAWLDYYFREDGIVYRVFRGGVLMQAVAVALGTGLAVIVLSQAPLWTGWHWVVLISGAFVLFPIQRHVEARFSCEVRPAHLEKVARIFCLRAHVGLVLVGMMVVSMLSPQTDYSSAPLEAVLTQLGAAGTCELATFSTRLFELKQESIYWLLQNQIGGYGDSGLLAVVGWGLSFLILAGPFSWGFTRLLVGLDYRGRGGDDRTE